MGLRWPVERTNSWLSNFGQLRRNTDRKTVHRVAQFALAVVFLLTHRALGLHTPASVHYGTATEIRAQRAVTLDAAYAANPSRFACRPTPPKFPTVAWINKPEKAPIENV